MSGFEDKHVLSLGNYREALTHQRCQLLLAMRLNQPAIAADALAALGHVYTAIGTESNTNLALLITYLI